MKKLTLILLIVISISSFAQDNDYNTLVEKGLTELKQQNSETAISYYKQALKLDTTRVEALYGLGVAYFYICRKGGQSCDKALIYLNKTISIDKSYRKSSYYRGSCKVLVGDIQGALSDFNNAIKLEPKNGYYYYNRAFLKLQIHDFDGGCADLQNSKELGYTEAKDKLKEYNCN